MGVSFLLGIKFVMIKLFRRFKVKKETHMNLFSPEYMDQLVAEHKLVSVSIARLVDTDYARFAKTHGVMPVDNAVLELKSRKIQLEAMIDSLRDYLN